MEKAGALSSFPIRFRSSLVRVFTLTAKGIGMSSFDSSWLYAQPVKLDGMLRHSSRRSPQKPAVICGDQVVRYEVLDRSTDALEHWLLREGIEIGDRVAIHWCNSLEVVTLFARYYSRSGSCHPVYIGHYGAP